MGPVAACCGKSADVASLPMAGWGEGPLFSGFSWGLSAKEALVGAEEADTQPGGGVDLPEDLSVSSSVSLLWALVDSCESHLKDDQAAAWEEANKSMALIKVADVFRASTASSCGVVGASAAVAAASNPARGAASDPLPESASVPISAPGAMAPPPKRPPPETINPAIAPLGTIMPIRKPKISFSSGSEAMAAA